MAKTKRSSTPDGDNFNIGDQVKHPKWGVGTILFRSGTGEDSKLTVVFPEEGQKKLMLKYANLKKAGATPKVKAKKKTPAPIPEPVPEPEIPVKAEIEGEVLEVPSVFGDDHEDIAVVHTGENADNE